MQVIILIETVFLFGSGVLLLVRRNSVPDMILGVTVGLFAYYLFLKWLFWTELIRVLPFFLIDTDMVAIASVPPFLYLYIVNLLTPAKKRKRSVFLVLVPAVVSLCWYVFYQFFMRPPVDVYFQSLPLRYRFWEIDVAFLMLIDLQVFVYLFFILVAVYGCLRSCSGPHRQHVRTIFLFFVSLTLCMVLFMVVMQFDSLTPPIIVHILFGGHGIFLVILGIKHPEYIQELQVSQQLRKNPLHNNQNEVKRILKELDALIRCEKVYYDPGISLQALSNRLDTTVYNLSFVLNEKIGMNFRSFINYHRIREAERLLAQEKDKSILEIAFQVGFNSKSTFNAMFRKQTGLSPSEYRRRLENSPENGGRDRGGVDTAP